MGSLNHVLVGVIDEKNAVGPFQTESCRFGFDPERLGLENAPVCQLAEPGLSLPSVGAQILELVDRNAVLKASGTVELYPGETSVGSGISIHCEARLGSLGEREELVVRSERATRREA